MLSLLSLGLRACLREVPGLGIILLQSEYLELCIYQYHFAPFVQLHICLPY